MALKPRPPARTERIEEKEESERTAGHHALAGLSGDLQIAVRTPAHDVDVAARVHVERAVRGIPLEVDAAERDGDREADCK